MNVYGCDSFVIPLLAMFSCTSRWSIVDGGCWTLPPILTLVLPP